MIVGDDELSIFPNRTSGDYDGNNGTNRAIAHSQGASPIFLFITRDAGASMIGMRGLSSQYLVGFGEGQAIVGYGVTAMDATNFYVGLTDMSPTMNETGVHYHWVAIL